VLPVPRGVIVRPKRGRKPKVHRSNLGLAQSAKPRLTLPASCKPTLKLPTDCEDVNDIALARALEDIASNSAANESWQDSRSISYTDSARSVEVRIETSFERTRNAMAIATLLNDH
jgi:hypothetical protein